MSEQNTVNIKQRMIGAIVLVSLGVIVIPLLLNGGPDLDKTFLDKNIPVMPKKLAKALPDIPQPMTMPAPKSITAHPESTLVKETTSGNKLSKQSKSENTSSKKVTPVVDTHYEKVSKPENSKINRAYTLQIASFSQKNNALALQSRLRKNKFKAYIESIVTSKGRIYRLRVGPYLKFEQISNIKKQIESKFKLSDTVIVKYKT
ncbi:MAG: SPOR domain-containing protein [gamma proteobacterium symbiont of Bathyaustriella thionipta]|nr:SPOR domain-containing protein [gamma proteobacterium symbiont of Bathyaustriella thionipta]MCU7950065.1 SPOR domain-containing protein [gamma proteobacterium symbiont of Bathyaustriella thionipta]MCU7952550.1 SPOR domain-containing protein [gamma proteobacterium symbiont of Bathyaustriella thionipta]MCU7957037.1 SPOR domain-containing protein [gamma proteobacterium symbiont of Bathyaustriella thionipta]MCU7967409.1 SPOR domain-containing protein [gamma proteobacterium symbiont of Bathyaustr